MNNNEALSAAIAKKDMKKFLDLLLHQPDFDLNYKNEDGTTLLMRSIKTGNMVIIKCLIKSNCEVNFKDRWERSPLHLAVAYREVYPELDSIAHMLIQNGADINAQNERDNTSLHCAVLRNDLEVASMLLYYEADVNITNNKNRTPIMEAFCCLSKRNFQEVLLNYCDDFSCSDWRGNNALHLATDQESPFAIDLVERGADINSLDGQGRCLLYQTCYNRNATAFKFIWSRINHKLLLNIDDSITPFFLYYLAYCRFSNSEYFECLYVMLQSPIAEFLIEDCINYPEYKNFCYSFVRDLLRMFLKRNVLPKARLSLIYFCLSFGVEIKIDDLQYAYQEFGLNDEFKALLYAGNLICYDYAEQIRYCKKLGVDFYTKGFSVLFFKNKQQLLNQIKTSAYEHKQILKALNKVPKFPSLLELSRNKAQKFIQQNCSIVKLYQFYDVVNCLKLPQLMKDVILLEKPIYGNLVSLEDEISFMKLKM